MPTLRVWSIAGTSPVLIAWRTVGRERGADAVAEREPRLDHVLVVVQALEQAAAGERGRGHRAADQDARGGDRGARRGLEGADRDQDAGGADRGHADRRDRPCPRVRDALDAPAAGERGGGDHRGDERDREHLDTRRRARSARRPPRAARSPAPRRSGSRASARAEPPREHRRRARRRRCRTRPGGRPRSRARRSRRRRSSRSRHCAGRSVASATASASARSCVATITVRSRCASAATVSAITRAVSGSSAAVGSSSRIASGSRVNARASATRARSPPDSAFAARGRNERVQPGGGQRRVAGVVGQRRQPVREVVRDRSRQHHRRLRDERDAPAQRAAGRRARMSLAVEPDRPRLGFGQPVQAAQERALARAGRAHEREHLTARRGRMRRR